MGSVVVARMWQFYSDVEVYEEGFVVSEELWEEFAAADDKRGREDYLWRRDGTYEEKSREFWSAWNRRFREEGTAVRIGAAWDPREEREEREKVVDG